MRLLGMQEKFWSLILCVASAEVYSLVSAEEDVVNYLDAVD